MSRVLVTGGAGFIGSFVARELLQLGHEVIIYDYFVQYVSPLGSHYQRYLQERFAGIQDDLTIVRGNTCDIMNLSATIRDLEPDRIIHLAALPIADLSNQVPHESVESIITSTVNLLHIAKEIDCLERLVYVSSSMIYGDFIGEPADEEHPKNPKEVYGGTKLAGEILTRSYGNRFGIPYTIIRPSAVYGPTDLNNRVSQKFIYNAFQGKPLALHNGGEARLDFTYVRDTAHGICLATFAEKGLNEAFNITCGQGRSLKEFVEILRVHFPDLVAVEKPADVFRPKRGSLDISKARELLGYEPTYDLEQGIEEYVQFMRKHFSIRSDDRDLVERKLPLSVRSSRSPSWGKPRDQVLN